MWCINYLHVPVCLCVLDLSFYVRSINFGKGKKEWYFHKACVSIPNWVKNWKKNVSRVQPRRLELNIRHWGFRLAQQQISTGHFPLPSQPQRTSLIHSSAFPCPHFQFHTNKNTHPSYIFYACSCTILWLFITCVCEKPAWSHVLYHRQYTLASKTQQFLSSANSAEAVLCFTVLTG